MSRSRLKNENSLMSNVYCAWLNGQFVDLSKDITHYSL
jgi:hypothetical protein